MKAFANVDQTNLESLVNIHHPPKQKGIHTVLRFEMDNIKHHLQIGF